MRVVHEIVCWKDLNKNEKNYINEILDCIHREKCSKSEFAPVPVRFNNCTFRDAKLVYLGATPGNSRERITWDDKIEARNYILKPMSVMKSHLDNVTHEYLGQYVPYILLNVVQCKFISSPSSKSVVWRICREAYLDGMMSLCSNMKMLIVFGKKAQCSFQEAFPDVGLKISPNQFKGK